MNGFLACLHEQRWDDHRYYHHSRVNQALHLVSATSFVGAYLLALKDPAMSGLVGWLVSMTSRQIGHLFFEPKGFDAVNQATHEHKEEIKVGYNLRRKTVLLVIWAVSPLLLLASPTLFGTVEAAGGWGDVARHVGYLWLALGVGGLLFRMAQLFCIKDLRTALVWGAKILTDPFHDIKLYHRAPACLLRGELFDGPAAHRSPR